jgi:FYVE/RhoGEF/PH domain-containing protein 5/6
MAVAAKKNTEQKEQKQTKKKFSLFSGHAADAAAGATRAPAVVPRSKQQESPPPKPLTAADRERMLRLRTKVIQEIESTELAYMKNLRLLEKAYLIPTTGILSQEDAKILFSNVQQIIELNASFSYELTVSVHDPSKTIGAVFLRFAPFFKLYIEFVQAHETASRKLSQLLAKNTKFRRAHDNAKALHETRGFSLASLLIMPIQRVPRYTLLIQSLNEQTPHDHMDKPSLNAAYDKMTTIANAINESCKTLERRNRIVQIEEQIEGSHSLVAPHRYFVRQGTLYKKCRREDKQFVFILMNDLLLYAATTSQNKYKVHRMIPVDQYFKCVRIDDAETQPQGMSSSRLQIFSTVKSFEMYCTEQSELLEWQADLLACIKQYEQSLTAVKSLSDMPVSTMPIWKQDRSVNKCPFCARKFTAFFRRHHCRSCGEICCDTCSKAVRT